jgi:hypothetical protein
MPTVNPTTKDLNKKEPKSKMSLVTAKKYGKSIQNLLGFGHIDFQELKRDEGKVVVINSMRVLKTRYMNPKTRRLNSMHTCLTCMRDFDKKCNLLDHLKIHAGERPYKC